MESESQSRVQPKAEDRKVQKAVAYVVRAGRLLVFTHDDLPIEITGVQVPAGTVEPGETPEGAVLREVREETGLAARLIGSLGTERYNVWPYRQEIHERHFFHLELIETETPERWSAGEGHSSVGDALRTWTCWWLPLENAHVLCAGFGARLAELRFSLAGAGHEATEVGPAT